MSNEALNSNVASVAKAHEILGVVGRLPTLKLSARHDVMNVKRSGQVSLVGFTPLTAVLVSLSNGTSKLLPALPFSKLRSLINPVVRMCWAFPVLSMASLGAENAATFGARLKGPEQLPALLAFKVYGGFLRLVCAFKRAAANGRSHGIERLSTYSAVKNTTPILPKSLMAFRRTENAFSALLIVRARELNAAMSACVRLCQNLRCRLASATAKYRRASVGFKLLPTLRAGLSHG